MRGGGGGGEIEDGGEAGLQPLFRPSHTPPPLFLFSEAFDLFDTDGTGAIDAKELKVALR